MAGFSSPLAPLCLWWLVNTCGAVWRYETSTGDYFIFSTRTVIYLQFEGTTFVEWDAPPLCSLVDKSKPETLLVCPVPGTHQIRPVVTVPSPDDEARFLSIIADVNCFMWYIYQDTSRLLDSDSTQFIHAWIFDPENAEDSETTHTAVSPSVYSKTLTKQFWNWGESPAITTFFGRKVYTDVQYKDGIWTLEVPSLTNDNIALFYGKAVTFQDCFILDTPFVIAQPKLHLDAQGYTITSPAGSLAKVTWAACFPSTAVLLTDFGVFYTSDAFLTSEELKIPADIIDRAIINDVKDVAIAFPDVFILIKDIVYKASEGEVIKLGSNQTVPDSGIIGIQAKTWCSAEYPLITVTFYHDADYSVAFDYETVVTTAQGVMTVEFQPSLSGKTCDSKIKLTHLRVGCSPEKRIEVTGKPSECGNITFTIPRSSLRNNEKDLEINYKVEEYGCPIEVDYRATFRPTVLLYMSNNPLGTVEANYIVWEVNDRIDFEYNSTMEEVHCLTTAQSWEQMIGNNTKTSSLSPTEIDLLWGPHNYKSCFITYVEDLRNLDEPYEILNHSGINSITWPQYHTGIYMFRLKIVDPNFSFCNLNALFAVRTYGIVKRPHWFLIAGWATMIVILFLGVLVYSYFRYVKTFRELNFTDPLMFDQDLNTTDSADEEGKEI